MIHKAKGLFSGHDEKSHQRYVLCYAVATFAVPDIGIPDAKDHT